jgi:hypothetical protein
MHELAKSPLGNGREPIALNLKITLTISLELHDGSVLDHLSPFLAQGDTQGGNGILRHVLGGEREDFENQLGLKSGVSSGKISTILAMLAPIVMGYLGKQTHQKQISDGKGLGGLLGGMMGGGIGQMLDQNGDGQVDMKDLGGLFGKK